ncbi:hypothetical protein CC86DRAFT_28106 [Ophiobolus disseminans]|uniref:Uncharacterized protein n=1 Tax=Ophiobolus disseminans TaxID=1469910 RepID=A0A6A6ZZA8_9PLEO|nr:hypothetical protein CC86DRAFT_28106 [Ophiobolus disseminans]
MLVIAAGFERCCPWLIERRDRIYLKQMWHGRTGSESSVEFRMVSALRVKHPGLTCVLGIEDTIPVRLKSRTPGKKLVYVWRLSMITLSEAQLHTGCRTLRTRQLRNVTPTPKQAALTASNSKSRTQRNIQHIAISQVQNWVSFVCLPTCQLLHSADDVPPHFPLAVSILTNVGQP